MIKQNDGQVIFIGGGNILGDEIQRAYNVGVDFHLMKGPPGAAQRFSKLSKEFKDKSFKGFEDLEVKLKKSFPNINLGCEEWFISRP